MKKERNIKKALGRFRKTFPTAGLDIVHYVIFQALIVLIVLGVSALWPYNDVMGSAAKVNTFLQEKGALPGLDTTFGSQIEHDISTVKGFFFKFGLIIAGGAIMVLLLSGLFRSLVYSWYRDTEYSWAYLKRFLLYNTLWLLFWTALSIICYLILVPGARTAALVIVLLLYFHLSVIFRSRLDEKTGLLLLIRKTFGTGFKRIHRFIIPSLVVLISYVAWIILFLMLIPYVFIRMFPAGAENAVSLVFAVIAILLLFGLTAFNRQYYTICASSAEKRG